MPDEQTRVAVPSDVNRAWKLPADLSKPLTSFQEAFVLSICPKGTHIVSARLHRTVQLPCPIWVDLTLPSGEVCQLILRMNYILGGVERQHLTFTDFAPRLALRCMRTLQENLPVREGEDVRDEWNFETLADYRQRVTGLLKRAIDAMNP